MAAAIQTILFYALIHPATIGVGLAMGARATEPQKLPIAALIAAIAGMCLLGLVGKIDPGFSLGHERAAGGMFIALLPFGLAWAVIGYLARRRLKSWWP